MSFDTFLGTVGVSILLVAFVLNLRGLLTPTDIRYQAMNAVGSGLACVASIMIGFFPFVVLEGVWFIAAASALMGLRWAASS